MKADYIDRRVGCSVSDDAEHILSVHAELALAGEADKDIRSDAALTGSCVDISEMRIAFSCQQSDTVIKRTADLFV